MCLWFCFGSPATQIFSLPSTEYYTCWNILRVVQLHKPYPYHLQHRHRPPGGGGGGGGGGGEPDQASPGTKKTRGEKRREEKRKHGTLRKTQEHCASLIDRVTFTGHLAACLEKAESTISNLTQTGCKGRSQVKCQPVWWTD